MATGWLAQGGSWYYLNPNGAMATGWLAQGGSWYYLNARGIMVTNTWINNYYLQGNGVMAPRSGSTSAPATGGSCPSHLPVKGNRNSKGEWIYHVPGGRSYNRTIPEQCFVNGAAAAAAGYRAARD